MSSIGEIDYFSQPKPNDLTLFFKFHPQQKTNNPIVNKLFFYKNGRNRKWVTYNEDKHTLHCSLCMAFGKATDINVYITGMSDWRHSYTRVQQHESSTIHRNCADAYIMRSSKSDLKSLLNINQVSAHREQVRKRRQVLERIVDVVKVIGKRGLSFRGVGFEAAYTLNDSHLDHGNFLELIILLGKYDVCLKEHLTYCINESKNRHKPQKKQGQKSGGDVYW